MPTDATEEVRSLSLLGFARRGRALALAARAWTTETADAVLAALDSGDGDDRRLGLYLAITRRDVRRVEAATRDPRLRRPALAAARRLAVSDDALAEVVLRGCRRDAEGAIRVIEHLRRGELADRLLPSVLATHGPAAARRLWRVCGLPRLEGDAAVHPEAWSELVERAPEAALRHALGAGRPMSGEHATRLAARCPGEALALLTRPDALPPAVIGHLLARPAAVLALLREKDWVVTLAGGPLPAETLRALRALPSEDLRELHDRCKIAGRPGSTVHPLFTLLPLDEREGIVERALARAAGSKWRLHEHVHPLDAHLSTLPASSVRRLVSGALAEPADADARRERLRALRRHLDLAQVQREHEALGPAADKSDRGERLVALASALRHEADPEVCAAVLEAIEPVWHDRWRTPALAALASLPRRLVRRVPVQTYRDAALTATQSRDSELSTLTSAERALRKAIHEALDRDDVARAAALTEVLVQVRLDSRVRWRAREEPPAGQPKPPELLPAPLEVSTAHARALREAVRPVRLEGSTPMLGPVGVGRHDPESEARVLAAVLGERVEAPVAEEPSCEGTTDEVLRRVKSIALRETHLVDGLLDRGDLTDPLAVDLLAAIPGDAERRWTPAQRRRFATHLARVADEARLPPKRRTRAVERIDDPTILSALLARAAGPVAAAALTRYASVAEPTLELRERLVERARRSGVVGRAAMAALDVLAERTGPAVDLTPYRALLLTGDCAVVNRRAAAARIARAATTEARDVLLAAWRTEGLHPDVRKVVLPGLARFVDHAESRQALSEGIRTIAGGFALLNDAPANLFFPGETSARPAVARAFVALAESLVESDDPSIAAGALRVCIREHRLCADGLALAERHLARPRTSPSTAEAIAVALTALPNEAAAMATWSAALTALAAAAATGDAWPKLRLVRLGGVVTRRAWCVPLASAQRAAGLHVTATGTFRRILDRDAAEGRRPDAELWSAYLELADAQPGRRVPWHVHVTDPEVGFALLDWLTSHGGVSAALTASELLLLMEAAASSDPRWEAFADRVYAMHPDAAERLLLAKAARGA